MPVVQARFRHETSTGVVDLEAVPTWPRGCVRSHARSGAAADPQFAAPQLVVEPSEAGPMCPFRPGVPANWRTNHGAPRARVCTIVCDSCQGGEITGENDPPRPPSSPTPGEARTTERDVRRRSTSPRLRTQSNPDVVS
jgi:hypothetical protein